MKFEETVPGLIRGKYYKRTELRWVENTLESFEVTMYIRNRFRTLTVYSEARCGEEMYRVTEDDLLSDDWEESQ